MDSDPDQSNSAPHPEDESPQVLDVQKDVGGFQFSRRDALKAGAVTAAAGALAGCGGKIVAPPAATLTAAEQANACKTGLAHDGQVSALAISPDGMLLVSSSDDKTVKLWALPEGGLLKTLKDFSGTIIRLVISPDSKLLAGSTHLGKVLLWSLPDGKQLKELDSGFSDLAISPDGRYLIGDIEKNLIRVWSLADGKAVQDIQLPESILPGNLSFSPDGSLIATLTAGSIQLSTFPEGKTNPSIPINSPGLMNIINFTISPDGKQVAVGGIGSTISILTFPEGKLVKSISGKLSAYRHLMFSPDGKILAASGALDHKIELWTVPDGILAQSFPAQSHLISGLAISPDGKYLYSANIYKTILIYSMQGGESVACLMDLAANTPETIGSTYQGKNTAGQVVNYTVPCGAAVPAGAVCTCNCVGGTLCTCVSHTSSGGIGGSHYWHPN